MNTHQKHKIENLENVVFVCFGRPVGNELPQVASEDDVVVDLLHEMSGKPLDLIDAELHHQTDPSSEQ